MELWVTLEELYVGNFVEVCFVLMLSNQTDVFLSR